MVATLVLEASLERGVGSSPTWGTKELVMHTAVRGASSRFDTEGVPWPLKSNT